MSWTASSHGSTPLVAAHSRKEGFPGLWWRRRADGSLHIRIETPPRGRRAPLQHAPRRDKRAAGEDGLEGGERKARRGGMPLSQNLSLDAVAVEAFADVEAPRHGGDALRAGRSTSTAPPGGCMPAGSRAEAALQAGSRDVLQLSSSCVASGRARSGPCEREDHCAADGAQRSHGARATWRTTRSCASTGRSSPPAERGASMRGSCAPARSGG